MKSEDDQNSGAESGDVGEVVDSRDDSCPASNRQKDIVMKHASQNGACVKSKRIQPDGQKLGNALQPEKYGDMSLEATRNASFQRFPLHVLVDRIRDSGYFYTGEGDKTVCHKCYAEVGNWNDKDDPASFHEPHCEYHSSEEPLAKDPQQLLGSTSTPVLLDAPITGSSSNIAPAPVVLKPTPSSLGMCANNNEGVIHRSVPMISEEQTKPSGAFNHQSLPLSGKIVQHQPKQFVAKDSNPVVEISAVFDKAHEDILKRLNLCSEEDRRKSFLFKNGWRENTNNAVKYRALAAGGFFYLGNLDRTQCFSCLKVLKAWRRQDKVARVHGAVAPECRMVQGREMRNIPIPKFQRVADSLSPATSQQPSLELPSSSTASAAPTLSFTAKDPVSVTFLQPSQTNTSENTSELHGLVKPCQPVHSMPSAKISVEAAVKPQQLGFAAVLNKVPYQESNIQKARLTQKIKIGDHVPMASSEDNDEQRQEAAANPNPTFPRPASEPVTSPTLSWHLGQTMIYNTPTAQTEPHDEMSNSFIIPEVPLVSGPVATATVSMPSVPAESGPTLSMPNMHMESGGEWAEAFLCDEPDNPQMRSTIMRQETFDFTWSQRGINNTDDMARAGFYAIGIGNRAKCWYCGAGTQRWSSEDDPWELHARMHPNCEFLLQQKGPEFVAEVSSRRPQFPPILPTPITRLPSDEDESPFSSIEIPGSPRMGVFGLPLPFGLRRQSSPPRVVDPRQEEENRKKMLQTTLDSELVFHAIEMGFEMPVIRRTVKKKILDTDSSFQSAEALLEALLDPPEESSSSSSEDEESAPSNAPGTSTSGPSTTGGAQRGEGEEAAPSFAGAEDLDPKQLDEKLREYEQEKRCKVCLDRDAEVVFVPCGHLCTCAQCAGVLRACPLCRKRIQKSMKIYTS